MNQPKYDLDYFIKKFTAIPEDKWVTGHYGNPAWGACALGHCGAATCSPDNDEVRALAHLAPYVTDIVGVNDGHNPNYQQNTPKQRILAFLIDLANKEAGDTAISTVKQIIANPQEVPELELV